MPDALIAGIVLESGSQFYTGNLRHFEFIEGLPVQNPLYR
jgi:predicted nucleic acid-binding protein